MYNLKDMRIILREDVKNLGKKGDIKEVAEGYARNFLLPRKLAEIATEVAVKNSEAQREKEKEKLKIRQEEAKKLFEKIQGKKVILRSKEKEGKLFGSILTKDIAGELAKEHLAIDEKIIKMEGPIKKIGTYTARVVLGKDLEAEISLIVEPEK